MAYEHTLIQVRERSFLEVLDLALVVLRNRPDPIGLAALAGIAPAAALNAVAHVRSRVPAAAVRPARAPGEPPGHGPLDDRPGGLMFGQRTSAVQVLLRLFRAAPALFVYQFLLRGFLSVTVLLYPVIPAKLVFLNEVILLERVPFWQTCAGARCSARRGGDLFAQWLAKLFFAAMFVTCFWFGTGVALSALTTSEMTWEQPGWGSLYGGRFQSALWLTITYLTVRGS